ALEGESPSARRRVVFEPSDGALDALAGLCGDGALPAEGVADRAQGDTCFPGDIGHRGHRRCCSVPFRGVMVFPPLILLCSGVVGDFWRRVPVQSMADTGCPDGG